MVAAAPRARANGDVMHLSDAPVTTAPPKAEVDALRALPWVTVYTPAAGLLPNAANEWMVTAKGYVQNPNTAFLQAAKPATDILRANGYTGKILGQEEIAIPMTESGETRTWIATPHPDLLAWLKAKGYTLKKAQPQTGQKTGADYASLWKGEQLIGVNSTNWSNKPGTMGYLTLGLLAVIAGGAALTGAGVIGSGAGTAAGAAAPAAAVVPGGAAAAGGSTAAVIGSTVVKAAPAVIGALSQVAKTTAESKAAEKQAQAAQEQAKAIEAITKAEAAAPSSSVFGPASSGFVPTSTTYFDPPRQQAAAVPARALPSWAIPAAIGAAALLALPLLLKRKGPRHATR
jgi:hypothetical protein